MAQPYDYRIAQPDVGNYFDAFRAGRAERLATEGEARNKSLAQYLPGALKGDAGMRDQALASASPDQQISLSGVFAQKDAAELAKIKQTQAEGAAMAVWADTPDKWALWNAEGKKRNPNHQDVPFERRGLILSQAQTVAEQLNQAIKEKELALDESRTRAQNAASYASADASRAAADFTRSGKGAGTFKPLPQRLQTTENGWLEVAQVASNNNADVNGYIAKIDAGEFDPGVLQNRYEQAKSFLGVVDPNDVNARNYNTFLSTMERLRNESLRLNKGVQTEGDAEREWNSLFQNINDKTVVRDQLARIAALNERAARQALSLARNQRKSFFGKAYEEPDWSEIGVNPSFLEAPRQAPTSFTRGGAGVFSDTQAGATTTPGIPAAPQGWSIKRVK